MNSEKKKQTKIQSIEILLLTNMSDMLHFEVLIKSEQCNMSLTQLDLFFFRHKNDEFIVTVSQWEIASN